VDLSNRNEVEVQRLLEQSRTKLLDLTLRNSLLNYSFKRKSRLIIVDELPNVLFERLLNGRSMKLIPIPYPDIDDETSDEEGLEVDETSGFVNAKTYAKKIGINVNEEIPAHYDNKSVDTNHKHVDNDIQTLHYADDLERLLRRLKSSANTAIQETGSNLLYFAIGFLEWKQNNGSDKIVSSPLILLPVQIERGAPDKSTGVYSYKLSYTDEDLFSNISLQYKMKEDFGVEIPTFQEFSSETPEEYFSRVDDVCKNRSELLGVSRKFALDFFHFSKLLMYLDLDPKNWSDENSILNNPILSEISGNTTQGTSQSNLSEHKPEKTENMGLVMDADSSQRDAIEQVMQGHNLIIEGPPGTGKSQTIANLIAVALSEGKSVLFIAEKLVALEVVKKRLDAVGLGDFILELHSHKSNKLNFYTSLKHRVDLEAVVPSGELQNNINEIEKIKANVRSYLNILHTKNKELGLTPYKVFGEVLNRYKDAYSELAYEDHFLQLSSAKMQEVSLDLEALMSIIKEDANILNSKWNGFISNNAISLDVDSIVKLFEELQDEYKNLNNIFENDENTSELLRTGNHLAAIDNAIEDGLFKDIPSIEDYKLIDSFKEEKIRKILNLNNKLLEGYDVFKQLDFGAFDSLEEIENLARTLRGFKDIGFFGKWFNSEYKQARRKFFMICLNDSKMDALSMSKKLEEYKESVNQYISDLRAFYLECGKQFSKDLGINYVDFADFKALPNSLDLLKKVSTLEKTVDWKYSLKRYGIDELTILKIMSENQSEFIESIYNLHANSKKPLENVKLLMQDIEHYGAIDSSVFFGQKEEFKDLIQLLSDKIAESDKLGLWIDVSRLLEKLYSKGFKSIITYVQEHNIVEQLKDIIEYGFYREWAHKLLRENELLAMFNRNTYETYLKNFRALDAKLGSLYAKEHTLSLSKKQTVDGINGRVSEMTEMRLIRNEIGKQKRHIPIRQTLKRAPKSIRSLKPCFMMSPLSVAQFIDPDQEQFDLMIMDEASQIFPEDSLGAIARAKQVVVVGDPNQLPPTNFFRGTQATTEEEDETVATTSESILDMMLRVYPNVKRLKWHYRSQHESLISFSNRHFYDSELMIFPSPNNGVSHVGIKRKFVANGYYKEQQNINEALSVVNDICSFLQEHDNDSLGVVSMNKKQSELIDRLLEEKTKEDQNIRLLVDKAVQDNRFFIKNLENVQGDEADTLFIATTYGPDPEAKKVYQRFGPINGEFGWRRINVLITRARKKVVVYTSLHSHNIKASNGNRGRTAFKNYLEYIESGQNDVLDNGSNDNELTSSFEESVVKYINSLGFVAKAQVGVAGFFIDIGVKVEGSYNYILGIECDGNTYHSNKSARDRDRIRQDILESMGWDIYRIWSTDWFKHQDEEKQRLKVKLESIKHKAILVEHEDEEIVEEVINDVVDIEDEDTAEELEEEVSETLEDIEDSIVQEDNYNVNTDLKSELEALRDQKIAAKYTIDNSCILSDRMIDLLVRAKPVTIEEFRMNIPLYLREKIDINQMEFIDDMFSIIQDNI